MKTDLNNERYQDADQDPITSVFNQAPELTDYNLFQIDKTLQESLVREGASWDTAHCHQMGSILGSSEWIEHGFLANQFTPELHRFDKVGNHSNQVSYHPSYHQLMTYSMANQLHSLPWTQPRAGAFAARSARYFLSSQNEAGHGCPITMTFASIPALKTEPKVFECWQQLILSDEYDPNFDMPQNKTALLCGMAMTERQGGSDVRSNITQAISRDGIEYGITGHKWFCSAPMSDVFLMLATTDNGITCFLVPRWRPDGQQNTMYIERLKDKLGNCSNASSEITLKNAYAVRIGEEGRGIKTIIKMVNLTRLDCIIGSAALMRQSLTHALHHTMHRKAFGRTLIEQPLMRNVLADLCLESEAATMLFMRIARSFDNQADPHERAISRIATAIGKFWVCKRAPLFTFEAMECLGGNGYVENSIMPRLYREAPLNSIWEGSGNVNALDVLRALNNEPETLEAFFAECDNVSSQYAGLAALLDSIKSDLQSVDALEFGARRTVEKMAIALQAVLMLQFSSDESADAFYASRVCRDYGLSYGSLAKVVQAESIIKRNIFEI